MNPGKYPLTIKPGEVFGRYSASGEIQGLDKEDKEHTQVSAVKRSVESANEKLRESIP